MLHINHASKHFASAPILNQINLSVAAETIVGLAGPSGSGKSTLLRCIQGLESLDQGEIQCAQSTGFVFQDFQLFPHMNVMNNLIYAPKLHKKLINHEELAQQLLRNLGIADKEKLYPHQLSGGQKQRVALARSLMMQPQLLLCDEPTSGLDLATIDEVIQLLTDVKDMGVSMIIASHDLDFLSKMADRIIVLKNGTFVADVIPNQLINPIEELKRYY